MEVLSASASFGGHVWRMQHRSQACDCDMTFSVFLPPRAERDSVPTLLWLSGLTCTDENFMIKAGAQRVAAELGLALLCPDTSPRGTDFPGEHDDYDFGSGAGFYVNATQPPWSDHYRMYDYVTQELPEVALDRFPLNGRFGISGHSMGGHGALVCYLRNPGKYLSVSAFAPIAQPSECPWGQKAFSAYLGEDRETWARYDATQLISQARERLPLLIDQGSADEWLHEQLNIGAFARAAHACGYPLQLRMQEGYDHGYHFVATFIDDHLRHHAAALS
jgi:S-formylglutathione hydrolase